MMELALPRKRIIWSEHHPRICTKQKFLYPIIKFFIKPIHLHEMDWKEITRFLRALQSFRTKFLIGLKTKPWGGLSFVRVVPIFSRGILGRIGRGF